MPVREAGSTLRSHHSWSLQCCPNWSGGALSERHGSDLPWRSCCFSAQTCGPETPSFTRNAIALECSDIERSARATSGGAAATRARLTGNRFEALGGMAIDLKGDGATNANDDGDGDTGPNELINHPVIERATRTTISGSAGATCANCTVELYLATHVPGGNDQGSLPTGAVASTDSQGRFTFANHGVATGQWVTAIVSDANGNTSEFGPSARVGTGQLQCEPETLAPGWQHVAFLGSEPTILGDSYPAGDGRVAAIYALTDGSTAFRRWLTGAEAGRTLTTLDPGEAYWMLVTSSFTPEGGFSLGAALSVALGPGWNDFVYFGPTADVRDALETIAGRYSDVFRFVPDSAGGHWMNWGGEGAPTWARGFAQMEACQVYQVFMTAAGTLTPPRPNSPAQPAPAQKR